MPRKPAETDTTSSNTDDAQFSTSGTSCSAASTSTSDISRPTGAASPANIGTDSGESEAAEEPRPSQAWKQNTGTHCVWKTI